MKILLLSDLHKEEEILDRLKPQKYDLVIIAGDFEGKGYLKKVLALGENIYWIPGNMEPENICEELPEKCVHKKELDLVDGLKLIGFGFSNPTPFGTPGELSEEQIYLGLAELPIDNKTILITHTPPYGTLDEVDGEIHAGSKSLQKIMEEKKPLFLACGHIHNRVGKEKVGETTVINIPPGNNLAGILLEIKDGRVHLDREEL